MASYHDKSDVVGVSNAIELHSPEDSLTDAEAHVVLERTETADLALHDPNLPDPKDSNKDTERITLEKSSEGDEVGEIYEDSPYPEVRSAVPPTDDVDMPANTIRAWVIGMLFVTIGSCLNMLFSMRNPSITITAIVAQFVSFWVGKGWERIMPDRVIRVAGVSFNLNPGKFNIKEHTVITIMSNVSFGGGGAYATSIIISQQHYYGQYLGWGYQILLVWSTQVIGYGLAGYARKFLVWPAAMIWRKFDNHIATCGSHADCTQRPPSSTRRSSILFTEMQSQRLRDGASAGSNSSPLS